MSKIAIITHYAGSLNYGGVLQAYALCRYLMENGYSAEQLSYRWGAQGFARWRKALNPVKSVRFLWGRIAEKPVRRKLLGRRNATLSFSREIPHSAKTYTSQTVKDCEGYDFYITGSDQVWAPGWMDPGFFLEFVPENKPRIAYAASLGADHLTSGQRRRFREKLAGFQAISVREKDARELLQPISQTEVEWTLDPTLLLMEKQWDEVCAERLLSQKYVFTYFLGGDAGQRKAAKEFAAKKGLPVAALPYLLGRFRFCDAFYGDRKLYDISPPEFISLIKHAEYVITDSFHAAVFSHIYKKEHFVFPRSGHRGMGSRIRSLMELFGTENHFCDTPEKVNAAYMEALCPIRYDGPFPEFEKLREKSEAFLKRNLSEGR